MVPTGVYGGAELYELIRRERVTHLFSTPAVLATIEPAGLDSVRVIMVGGEAFSPELVTRWAIPLGGDGEHGLRDFYNVYGPTEATIVVNIGEPLLPGDTPTIGGPDPRRAVAGAGQPAPARTRRCRGRAVCRGRRGDTRLSGPVRADRRSLRRQPLRRPGERMYRTGDVVRWSPGSSPMASRTVSNTSAGPISR